MLGRLVLTLVVITLVAMAGAAWHFSDQIDSGALRLKQPGPWPRTMVAQAVDASAGTMTLAAPSGQESLAAGALAELDHPFVTGLYWEGGFAQTQGAPTSTTDPRSVTRQVKLIEGTLPAVGAAVGTHTFAYPQGPRPPQTQVTYPGPTGPLTAYLSRPANPPAGVSSAAIPEGTWAIMVHGKGAEPDEFDRITPTFLSLGIPALAIQYRGDPGQPPATDGRYGFGVTEWPDLEAAVRWALGQGAKRVVLVGASMGGAVVAAYLRHAGDTSPVWKVVLDSPALHLQRVIEWGAEQIALPGGLALPAPVTWGAQRLTTLRTGLDWPARDYLNDVSWVRAPTLVFHGGRDRTVPVTISRDLAATRGTVTLVEVAQADHVQSWNVDPGAYEAKLLGFLTLAT